MTYGEGLNTNSQSDRFSTPCPTIKLPLDELLNARKALAAGPIARTQPPPTTAPPTASMPTKTASSYVHTDNNGLLTPSSGLRNSMLAHVEDSRTLFLAPSPHCVSA